MRADIIPALAVAAGVDLPSAADAFDKARVVALRQNRGRDDTRAFVLTVEGFRSIHPFKLADLGSARQAVRDATNAKSSE